MSTDEAFEKRVVQYAARFDTMVWFGKDALFGGVASYMFAALGWRFGRELDAHALSGLALALLALTPPSAHWVPAVCTVATAATVAADLRTLGKLSFMVTSPCAGDLGATPARIADACTLSSTTSVSAYAVMLALVCVSLLSAFRRASLVFPDDKVSLLIAAFASFWMLQSAAFTWPGWGVYASVALSCLLATATFCLVKYDQTRKWSPIAFCGALLVEGAGVFAYFTLPVPSVVAVSGALTNLSASVALCGMMYALRL